ncbi:MAG: hypothetical protein K0Q67_260 [Cellvibrio sp.]|jgi:hypothetical protein|nr:hypothetical protein [Cellvibrio sp.]
MKSIALNKSTFISMLFIITNALNCSAGEPVTEKPLAVTEPYRLVDIKGKPTSINAHCAIIESSGLTWELKTDDGGIHDKDNVYRWGGIGAEKTGTIFFDDWNSLLNATNNEKLCGFNDWRVPTIEELKTLVTSAERKPVIDTSIFSLTQAMPYWSVSTYQHYPEHAQTVDFATGTSNYYTGFRGDRLPVHLVRGNKKQ